MMKRPARGRGAQVEREWRILEQLEARPRTRCELARTHAVSTRTIARDVDVLSAFFPITEEKNGRDVVYSFSRKDRLLQARLTAPELLALGAARKLVSGALDGTMFDSAYRSALTKLQGAMPSDLRSLADSMARGFGADLIPRQGRAPDPVVVEILRTAVLEDRTVEIEYWTLYRDEESRRKVDPYWLLLEGGTLKVVGHCHWRNEVRIFSVEHIRSAALTREGFRRPAGLTVEGWLREGFAGFRGPAMDVKVRLRGRTARWVTERSWHPTQKVTRDRGGAVLSFRAGGLEAIARWVMGLGPEAEVIAPSELREEVARRYAAGSAMHGAPGRARRTATPRGPTLARVPVARRDRRPARAKPAPARAKRASR